MNHGKESSGAAGAGGKLSGRGRRGCGGCGGCGRGSAAATPRRSHAPPASTASRDLPKPTTRVNRITTNFIFINYKRSVPTLDPLR